MFKKSLFALFSCLIISGLFLVGSADAMTYIVSGNISELAIPQSYIDDDMEITRGDGNTDQINGCDHDNLALGVPSYKCQHTYSTNNSYTVSISNPHNRPIKTILLAYANITNITNFENFSSLTTIWLNNNDIKQLSPNIFQTFSNSSITVYLDSNKLGDYSSYLDKIGTLTLTHNQLTTIPEIIWNSRGSFDIILNSDITLGNNGSKMIDLSNNPINFVGITKFGDQNITSCGDDASNPCIIDSSANTNIDIERFGYSHNTAQIEYTKILSGITTQYNYNLGTSTDTGIMFSEGLIPGTYVFETCYNEGNDASKPKHCDSIYFIRNYDEDITIYDPDSSSNYSSLTILGLRGRTGNYPDDLFSGYQYIIENESYETTGGFISKDYTDNSCSTSTNCANIDIGSIIENERGNNNGTYTLTVDLIDIDGNIAQKYTCDYWGYCNWENITASTGFTIEVNNDFTITSPSSSIWELPITFAWNTDSTSSNINFEYHVAEGDSCSNSSTSIAGSITDKNVSFTGNLPNGDYILCVSMYVNSSLVSSNSQQFTVNINPTLTIDNPQSGVDEQGQSINFSRHNVIPDSYNAYISNIKYDYTVTGGAENNTITGRQNFDGTSFTLENLTNGSYTFTVVMHYKDNGTDKTLTGKVNFQVNLSEADYVNITKPEHNSTIVATGVDKTNVTFQWNGGGTLLDHYIYSVRKSGSEVTGGTASKTQTTFDYELDDGNYTFTVTSYNNSNNQLQTQTINFTVKINSTLNITSPTNGITIVATGTTTTGVKFTWNGSGYHFKKYHYTIKDSSNSTVTGGDIMTEAGGNITRNLGNGSYTFTVNMLNTGDEVIASGKVTFTISISSTLNITSPENWADLTAKSNTFTWTGFTPNEFSNYTREIKKGGTQVKSGTKNSMSDTSVTIKNLRDGNYTFKVTMNYTGGPESAEISFKVSASNGVFLNITSPNQPTYIGNNITTVPINFTWTGGKSALIDKYKYEIKNGTDNQVTGGTVNKDVYAIPGTSYSLPSGTYKFEVTMLDDENNSIIETGYIFNVSIPSHLNIISPSPADVQLNGAQNVSFSRSGFAEFANRYHYEWILEKTKKGSTTTTTGKTLSMTNMAATGFQRNLGNGLYKFTVKIMSGNTCILSGSRSFSILDQKDLQAYISDGNAQVTTLRSTTGVLIIRGRSEDFHGYYYSITGTTFTGALYSKTGTINGSSGLDINLTNLNSGKYRYYVKMLDSAGDTITSGNGNFNVEVPARLKITSPAAGSTVASSSATFSWTGYSDAIISHQYDNNVIVRYEYSLSKAGENIDQNNIVPITTTSFTRTNLTNGNYTLTVWISSGGNLVASDTVNFTIAIPVRTSGSSSKSHTTNNLNVSVTNDSPKTNERVEVVVDIDDRYTGKVDFTKMQIYSGGKWIDIPITSENYVSDYSDDAKLGYVRFSSDDDGEKELSQFIMFTQTGNYRLYAEDKDGYKDYTEFYIGNGKVTTTVVQTDDDDYYIARSCKKYKIKRYDSLQVYSSPNLLMNEYFVNKEYFKRYIDSKNRYQEGCPTNVGWISTSYYDKSNSNSRYTAPNGKVYFIIGKEGNYYSNELNKELKTPTSFNTIEQLKTYIKDRNPLIDMSALGPVK